MKRYRGKGIENQIAKKLGIAFLAIRESTTYIQINEKEIAKSC